MEQIAQPLPIEPAGELCMTMQGLIKKAQDLLAQLEEGSLADAAIRGVAQKMEHYEMAAYGTARTLAEQSGKIQIARLLETTLKEEKATDEKLTFMAVHSVNLKATQP